MKTTHRRPGTAQDASVSHAYPLGSTLTPEGTHFSVFSAHATRMEIVFFDHVDSAKPFRIVPFDPEVDRTANYWHIFVPGISVGQLYGYRADGPSDPLHGERFDPFKILLDPYGKGVAVGRQYSRAAASHPGDNAAYSMKSVTTDLDTFDWEGDTPIHRAFRETIIYEMHVGGLTRNPNSGVNVRKRGTYLGVIDKIPYLQGLGITAVELLPVFQFDAQSAPVGLSNYWGYNPVSLFAPHLAYSTGSDPLVCLDEFRTMVKALHRAGIEVILDVVYNHTAEAGEHGPTLCFRGLENSVYYILGENRATYADYSGAGNTLKANHSVVKRLIVDSLQYWVSEMHVDGFRFDLASIFSRDEAGEPMPDPPIVWEIDSDPVLAGTKLIAEAWDAAGLYQVGSFGPDQWKEWNGRFRDTVRSFVKGDPNTVASLKERISGSYDLYKEGDRPAGQSINFVTCHDGFTLADLVSYNVKHNEANRELNRDGLDTNESWNCGEEGPSDEPEIKRLRLQQSKNLLALTLLSVGTPMLMMGDECRRTQGGNNNAYCQDNETSWFDWDLCSANADLMRFVKWMVRLRLNSDQAKEGTRITLEEYLSKARIEWHGVELDKPDWGDDSHSLALSTHSFSSSRVRYIAMNSYWKPLTFELPPVSAATWLRLVDTSLPTPEDAIGEAVPVKGSKYLVSPRSLIVLHCDYAVEAPLLPGNLILH